MNYIVIWSLLGLFGMVAVAQYIRCGWEPKDSTLYVLIALFGPLAWFMVLCWWVASKLER